jgi:ferredoxin-NADP reductase
MAQSIKQFLNRITMYRLMLYFLILLWGYSIVLSLAGFLAYHPTDILFTGTYLVVICNLVNYLLAKALKARTNFESASITALILTLIVGPFDPIGNFWVLTVIGSIAMASKYALAVRKKHIFNPAALAVLSSAYLFTSGASWWIGSLYTLPILLLGGFLVLTKIRRFGLVTSFLAIYFMNIVLFGKGVGLNSFLAPSIWFFTMVMLIEPLTSPSTRNKQLVFGSFTALIYILLPKVVPGYGYGLETALLTGNLLNFVISPSFNLVMIFKRKEKVAENTWAFYFEPMSKFNFSPGQYLEWTLPHKNPDSRGVRRYFTISSAPEEKEVMFAIRINEKGSSFKSALMKLSAEEEVTASNPQGDFVLPKDKSIPLVFIAGGIGVTPFHSMVKSLLAKNDQRDIIMLYSNREESGVAFRELFEKAETSGVKTFYIITKKDGYIDEKMIREKVPDYQRRIFYISGPELAVEACENLLTGMSIRKIKTDFFPGYQEAQ